MLSWSIAFFMVAIVAAVLGFGDVGAGIERIARIAFFISLAIGIVALLAAMVRSGRLES